MLVLLLLLLSVGLPAVRAISAVSASPLSQVTRFPSWEGLILQGNGCKPWSDRTLWCMSASQSCYLQETKLPAFTSAFATTLYLIYLIFDLRSPIQLKQSFKSPHRYRPESPKIAHSPPFALRTCTQWHKWTDGPQILRELAIFQATQRFQTDFGRRLCWLNSWSLISLSGSPSNKLL